MATRVAVELAGARGYRWADLEDGLLERARRWLAEGAVPEGEEVRERRVYRVGDRAVKLFPAGPRPSFWERFRSSPAVRSAELHFEILPVRSPRPLLALEDQDGASALVYEWVEGRSVDLLWGSDAAAVEALPAFLASMHARRVFHGDFHVHNFVWDGAEWVLLDLVGLRHALRRFARGRRLAIDHWGALGFGLERHCGAAPDDVRPLFDRYAELSPTLGASDWPAVVRRWRAYLRRIPAP